MVAQRLTLITLPAATPDQLWQRVEAAWSAVPQEHIQGLFESMPRRFCEWNTRNRWRDGQVCPDVNKELWRLGPDGSGVFWRWTSVSRCGRGTMAPWARRLGYGDGRPGEKKKGKEEVTRKERSRNKGQESPGERTDGEREENPRVLIRDAVHESKTRMSKNALRSGRRQAVE
ncbi:hypothetical protein TNCV_4484691 [Trichonephila clavipes]|nr:hypothetical protein TNCV_4484691 [Trichonephila clavipes]